jgi:hypothetical protein
VRPLSVATGHAPAPKPEDYHREYQADAQQLARQRAVALSEQVVGLLVWDSGLAAPQGLPEAPR